jgi:uncharacterized protein (DUF736 family)
MSTEFGQLARDEKTQGYVGDFEMLDITRGGVVSIPGMQIIPIPDTERSSNPDFPHWRVLGGGVKMGSGWNKQRQADGAPYISLSIEHPQINDGRPLTPVLMESARQPGVFNMFWERSDATRAADPTPSRGGTGPTDEAPAPGAGTKRRR